MFGIRVAAFVISILLATKAVSPDPGWFIALAVFTGLSIFGISGLVPRIYIGGRPRRWRWLDER